MPTKAQLIGDAFGKVSTFGPEGGFVSGETIQAVPPPKPPSVFAARIANALKVAGATAPPPVAPFRPYVGAAGSAGNAGNIAGANGNRANDLGASLNSWQLQNPGIDTALRIGLPAVGAFLLVKGHTLAGVGAIAASAPFWYTYLGR